jgi:hypothetical protein
MEGLHLVRSRSTFRRDRYAALRHATPAGAATGRIFPTLFSRGAAGAPVSSDIRLTPMRGLRKCNDRFPAWAPEAVPA